MEWDSKTRNAFSALILIVIIVIYTFYRMNSTGETSVSVGVDDSKIGIVTSSEDAVFIQLGEVRDMELVEDCSVDEYVSGADAGDDTEGTDTLEYRIYADETIDTFVVLTTPDAVYITNTTTAKATKSVYQDIIEALEE